MSVGSLMRDLVFPKWHALSSDSDCVRLCLQRQRRVRYAPSLKLTLSEGRASVFERTHTSKLDLARC